MITLYIGNKAYSSWSMRGWLAVRQSGLPFEETVVPMYTDEWQAACEQPAFAASDGKVPVLADGNTFVWDSLSIVEYCAEQAGRHLFSPAASAWASPPPPAPSPARWLRRCTRASRRCATTIR